MKAYSSVKKIQHGPERTLFFGKFVFFCVSVFSLILSPPSTCADNLFNPGPVKIESPRDNPDVVMARLNINSDGKTPVVKDLEPAWVKSLADRGVPALYTKANSHNFDYIGMPVGGIGAGEVYLSGDGRLWDWDIFGVRFPYSQCPSDWNGTAYVTPHKVADPADPAQTVVEQGFVIRTRQGEKVDTRTLDKNGFSDVTFSGQYPVGYVDYADPASAVRVHLEAFSPYIPSNLKDSTYPATFLNYTVENTTREKTTCTVGGWLENAVGINLRKLEPVLLENSASKNPAYTVLNFAKKEVSAQERPVIAFGDFESGTYQHWTVEGDAFGDRPVTLTNANPGEVFCRQ